MENSEKFFAITKIIAFATLFGLTVLLQLWRPYKNKGLDRKILLKSWRHNFSIGLFNTLSISILSSSSIFSLALHQQRSGQAFLANHIPSLAVSGLITVLCLDLISYFWHRLFHQYDLLWRAHAVHHSDPLIESSSAVRFHLFEVLPSMVLRWLVVWAVGFPAMALLVFEIVYLFFNFFEHSYVRLNSKFELVLGRVFITPSLHRWHHSIHRRESNSNFGTIFSFWDRIFRTQQKPNLDSKFSVGLDNFDNDLNTIELLKLPLSMKT
jgi:sterol desaturase/sphingolipid hydroxylase (fatty acid hydroxylase superfamily)